MNKLFICLFLVLVMQDGFSQSSSLSKNDTIVVKKKPSNGNCIYATLDNIKYLGTIRKDEFLSQVILLLGFDSCFFSKEVTRFEIISFEMTTLNNGLISTLVSNDLRITYDMRNVISALRKGDKVVFERIKVIDEYGTIYLLKPLTIIVG